MVLSKKAKASGCCLNLKERKKREKSDSMEINLLRHCNQLINFIRVSVFSGEIKNNFLILVKTRCNVICIHYTN